MAETPDAAQAVLDAERAVLGAMMLSREAVLEVSQVLSGAMFREPRHETIYDAVLAADAAGGADPVTVQQQLIHGHELERAGGPAYLHELQAFPTTAANAEFYAQQVRSAHIRRSASQATAGIQQALMSGGDVSTLVGEGITTLESLLDSGAVDAPQDLREHLEPTLERFENGTDSGYTTGLREWDDLTGGLAPGSLTVIGARPGMGKTVMGLNIARANARAGVPVLFNTREMSGEEIMARIISAECTIPSNRLRMTRPQLQESDWAVIAEKMPPLLQSWDFALDTSMTSTIESLVARIRAHHRKHPRMVVIIDYLQLLDTAARIPARHEKVSLITRQLKLTALALNIPIVLLSQLNRESESRSDKRPVAADLRESGSVEQDSDMIALLHREDLYDKESPRAGEMDVIVAKHRHGPTKTISVAAQLHYMRLMDMAHTDEPGWGN